MAKATRWLDSAGRFAIEEDRIRDSGNTSHDQVNERATKTKLSEGSTKENPLDAIIGFRHV